MIEAIVIISLIDTILLLCRDVTMATAKPVTISATTETGASIAPSATRVASATTEIAKGHRNIKVASYKIIPHEKA